MRCVAKFYIVIFLLFTFAVAQAQTIEKAKNIISLDFGIVMFPGAAAVGIGINYERMLNDNISLRTGINIGILAAGGGGDAFANSGIGFPITINFMTNNKNKFEVGVGGGPRLYFGRNYNKIELFPAARLGYRYQPDEKGAMYRLGFDIPANTYLSIFGTGYHF